MGNLQVIPDAITSAASDLANIGTYLSDANTLAAASTTSILPAAADEVSAAISELFNAHGQWWQSLAAQAAQFQESFVQNLNWVADTYLGAEQANAVPLNPPYPLTPEQQLYAATHFTNPGVGLDIFHLRWGIGQQLLDFALHFGIGTP